MGRSRLITGRAAKVRDDAKPRRPHKYGAKRTEVDGIWFDSKAEAKRYEYLKVLQAAGEIANLKLQPVFILQDGFEYQGKQIKAITYRGDFQYTEHLDAELGPGGHAAAKWTVVEDVKGVATAVFRLKQKMFLKRYPAIELRIVR